jgi:hypothetical protein
MTYFYGTGVFYFLVCITWGNSRNFITLTNKWLVYIRPTENRCFVTMKELIKGGRWGHLHVLEVLYIGQMERYDLYL